MSEETRQPDNESPGKGMPRSPGGRAAEASAVTRADFDQLDGGGLGGEPAALSLLYELNLPVTVELGRTRMAVQDILALGRGSVIQLDRVAGEPVDVYVGDRRFAEGEVVIVGEQFGIRITRILSASPVPAEVV